MIEIINNMMESFNQFISDHLSDFVIEAFACFLGFLSGLIMQSFIDNKNKKSTKKVIQNGIKNELKKVEEVLNQLSKHDFGIDLYNCPFWDSIVSSGQVDLIVNDPHYEDIVYVYYKLKTANSWERLNTNYCIDHEQLNAVLSNKVVETREELKLMIIELLPKLV